MPIVPPEQAHDDCWPGVHEEKSFELPEPHAAPTPMRRSARSPAVEAEPPLLEEVRSERITNRKGSFLPRASQGFDHRPGWR